MEYLTSTDTDPDTLRAPITCPPLDAVFAPGGAVANVLGAWYRPRPGQIQMANLVRAVLQREALQSGKHAIIEAGTGIGKSFAYLLPLIWSGTPGIVSTSNKALMNQLWDKDIPLLHTIAPRPFKAALLKGRSNYLCALRLDRFRKQAQILSKARLPGFGDNLALVDAALEAEPSGDCERMSLPAPLRAQLTVRRRECEGARCAMYKHCLYERAKREAAAADLVVTNHALLCYNVFLTENHTLPIRPALVIDEAHQLVSYAINALTLALEHDLFWHVINHQRTRESVDDTFILGEAREAYQDFFQAVAAQRPPAPGERAAPINKWALEGEFQDGLALWDALKDINTSLQRSSKKDDDGELDALVNQSADLVATMDALARPEPDDHIRFCEIKGEGQSHDPHAYHAQRSPLEVANVLANALFKLWPRVICTSATLSVNRDLGWFRRQVGVENARAFSLADVTTRAATSAPISTPIPNVLNARLDSPFDYKQQMLVYTPLGLEPAYGGEAETVYADKLAAEVRRLLDCSQGRALVLCTSRRRMQDLYQRLAPDLRALYPCYCQGELPQPEIVRRFKADGNAIIVATRSFWEGIDIPGDALSLVILDKIPFLPLQDPVVQRHEALIKKRGGVPFQELQLGNAILALRQGAGRLIRSETDRGVIALLDSRIHTKRYGRQIVRSLPDGCHTADFARVEDFLQKRET